jgi:hypothetical protein
MRGISSKHLNVEEIMRAISTFLVAGLAATGSSGSAAAAASGIAVQADAERCALPRGWETVTKDDPRYIVFGELHGIVESPAFVGDVACALAGKDDRLLVAFELGSDQNDALQKAWQGPHDRFADAVLAGMPDWMRRSDGVTSEAMLALLVRLHALKNAGAAIEVVAFNGPRDEEQKARFADLPLQGPWEAAQAENIRMAADACDYDRVLVLVGNIHAQRRPFERQDGSFEPMAMRLARSGKLVSLELIYGEGTHWGCRLRPGVTLVNGPSDIKPGDMVCAGYLFSGRAGISGERRVGFWPTEWQVEGDTAYDGYAWVGPAHASPPAVDGAGSAQ